MQQEPRLSLTPFPREDQSLGEMVRKSLLSPIEKTLGLGQLDDLYQRARRLQSESPGKSFAATALEILGVGVNLTGMEKIPREDALVIVANHPFGGVEGIALALALGIARPDLKIMANYLLSPVPELADFMIYVDPFRTRGAVKSNMGPVRHCLKWLRQGGALLVFPAGEVAHWSLATRRVMDPEWQPAIGRLIRVSGAQVTPIFIEGHNDALFQAAGILSPRLRTLLLPRALLKRQGTTLRGHVGKTIGAAKWGRYPSDKQLISYLRLATYALAPPPRGQSAGVREPVPVVDALPDELIAEEVNALPAHARLLSSGNFDVYLVPSSAIPLTMIEIGRLREKTFRGVGEGTGKILDIDPYDAHYEQLFLWDRKHRRIAGAYRIGRTDVLLEKFGKKGLYTSSLFRIRTAFLKRLSPALEMGRSFVAAEYQKNFLPLMLLWQGIGRFVVKNPHYAVLFGPVSIANTYSSLSREILVNRLLRGAGKSSWRRAAKGNYREAKRHIEGLCSTTLEELADDYEALGHLLADLEPDGKGIPVLLRQYLKLNGKILAFNLDANFGEVLDALLVVDLRETDEKALRKYLGKEGCEIFQAARQNDRHAA